MDEKAFWNNQLFFIQNFSRYIQYTAKSYAVAKEIYVHKSGMFSIKFLGPMIFSVVFSPKLNIGLGIFFTFYTQINDTRKLPYESWEYTHSYYNNTLLVLQLFSIWSSKCCESFKDAKFVVPFFLSFSRSQVLNFFKMKTSSFE